MEGKFNSKSIKLVGELEVTENDSMLVSYSIQTANEETVITCNKTIAEIIDGLGDKIDFSVNDQTSGDHTEYDKNISAHIDEAAEEIYVHLTNGKALYHHKVYDETLQEDVEKIEIVDGFFLQKLSEKADNPNITLGQTPIVYQNSGEKNIKLVGENASYVGYMNTVSDIAHAVSTGGESVTKDESVTDFYKYIVSGGSSWARRFFRVTFGNLIVGKEYKCVIDVTGIEAPSDVSADISWLRLNVDNSNYVYIKPNSGVVASRSFTATAETQTFKIHFNPSVSENSYIAFNDVYCQLASASNEKTEIQNISGTVEGETVLTDLTDGIHIESTPSCNVIAEMPLSTVYKVDGILPDESGNVVLPKSKLNGKVIVNFGDSIFGNFAAPNDISTELANLTGATVHNVGFGGCRMGTHTTDDYKPFSMYRLAQAIAEDDWAAQDTAAAGSVVPSYFAAHLELLKSIDFSEVDIITIAYGTNDFAGGKTLDDTTSETPTLEPTFFAGALRLSIETLLTAYPNLRIFICGQVYRFWDNDDSDTHTVSEQKLTDFIAKTKEVANNYHLPYIDNYYELGINKFNRSQFFPSTDNTHPNLTGRKLIAHHIFKELF